VAEESKKTSPKIVDAPAYDLIPDCGTCDFDTGCIFLFIAILVMVINAH
jgi:hypothetical protein